MAANGYHYYFAMDQAVAVGAAISAVFRDTLKPLVDAAFTGVDAALPIAVPAQRTACLEELVVYEKKREILEGSRYDAAGRWLELRQRC